MSSDKQVSDNEKSNENTPLLSKDGLSVSGDFVLNSHDADLDINVSLSPDVGSISLGDAENVRLSQAAPIANQKEKFEKLESASVTFSADLAFLDNPDR